MKFVHLCILFLGIAAVFTAGGVEEARAGAVHEHPAAIETTAECGEESCPDDPVQQGIPGCSMATSHCSIVFVDAVFGAPFATHVVTTGQAMHGDLAMRGRHLELDTPPPRS